MKSIYGWQISPFLWVFWQFLVGKSRFLNCHLKFLQVSQFEQAKVQGKEDTFMYAEYEDLTPEERLERIIELLTRWALRLEELKKKVNDYTDAIDRKIAENIRQDKTKYLDKLT